LSEEENRGKQGNETTDQSEPIHASHPCDRRVLGVPGGGTIGALENYYKAKESRR